jgi:hypothetical protein
MVYLKVTLTNITVNKLRMRNITSKAPLCYGSEKRIINEGDTQKLEVAQMRIMRPLLGLTRQDCYINPGIHNEFKVKNL